MPWRWDASREGGCVGFPLLWPEMKLTATALKTDIDEPSGLAPRVGVKKFLFASLKNTHVAFGLCRQHQLWFSSFGGVSPSAWDSTSRGTTGREWCFGS